MTTSPSTSDLSLTAFRYLAGELTAAEFDAFEQRLATDDAAQQALVRAVQVAAAVQSSATVPAIAPAVRIATQRRPERNARWSGIAALVGSGLVAATMFIALRQEQEAVGVVSSDAPNVDTTVSLWTELDVDEIEAALDEGTLATFDGESTDAVQVPDWMFAAIETDFGGDGGGRPPATDVTDEDS